jgi:hypothetical protein
MRVVVGWCLQVASGDLGASQPFYFPFSPAYWGFKSRAEVVTGDTLGQEKLLSAQVLSLLGGLILFALVLEQSPFAPAIVSTTQSLRRNVSALGRHTLCAFVPIDATDC